VGKSLNLAGQLAGGAGRMVAEVAPDLAHQPSAVIKEYSSELALDGKPLPPSAVREIATQLKNYLAEGDAGRTPQNRTALAQALSNHTKMSQEEVTRTVDEWTSSYDRTAAEVKAAADRASTVTGASALWTFLAFWVGAISASWGGKLGAVGFAKTSQATHTHSDREIPISHAH
jgi:hypothetical protein